MKNRHSSRSVVLGGVAAILVGALLLLSSIWRGARLHESNATPGTSALPAVPKLRAPANATPRAAPAVRDQTPVTRSAAMREPRSYFPDTLMGQQLDQCLRVLVMDFSAQSFRNAEECHAALQENRREAVAVLTATYRKLPVRASFDRYVVVEMLSRLAAPEAFDALIAIVGSDGPGSSAESAEELGHGAMSEHGREQLVRMRAVAGLGLLAKQDHAGAAAELLKLAASPSGQNETIRDLAIESYLAAGTDTEARVATLIEHAPAEHHGFIRLAGQTIHDPRGPESVAQK